MSPDETRRIVALLEDDAEASLAWTDGLIAAFQADPTDPLGSIERAGWRLYHALDQIGPDDGFHRNILIDLCLAPLVLWMGEALRMAQTGAEISLHQWPRATRRAVNELVRLFEGWMARWGWRDVASLRRIGSHRLANRELPGDD
jgi:hypothetical protein